MEQSLQQHLVDTRRQLGGGNNITFVSLMKDSHLFEVSCCPCMVDLNHIILVIRIATCAPFMVDYRHIGDVLRITQIAKVAMATVTLVRLAALARDPEQLLAGALCALTAPRGDYLDHTAPPHPRQSSGAGAQDHPCAW